MAKKDIEETSDEGMEEEVVEEENEEDLGVDEEETQETEEKETSEEPRSDDREMFKIKCAECGKDAEVPFKPTEGRPVYCRDCFMKHRKPRRSFGYNRRY